MQRRISIRWSLAGVVAISALVRYELSRRVVAPWIMVDELIYSELAKSFASGGHFLIRGVHHGAYGFVYPALIAAAWRVFSSVPDAYSAAKAIGSVLMSLTAVPVYFLARRVVRPVPSLASALLAVAVPSMVYTGTLMTETIFYPLFACVALMLVLTLERPTIRRQLLLLAISFLAFMTRSQAIVLIPAVATAPVLLAWLDRRRLRALTAFKALYGVLVVGIVGVLALQFARGHSAWGVLGSYSVTGHVTYHVDQVLKWLVYHLSELDVYLGVAPFAALLLLTFMARSLDARLRVFLAAALPLTGWLIVEVAAFASALSPRVEERNLFYVAPLFFIALLAWIERGMPRPARVVTAAALVAAALPAALPYHSLIGPSAESDTLALLPLWWLQDSFVGKDTLPVVVVALAASIAVLFMSLSPRCALVLPGIVLLWFAFATERIERSAHGFPKASIGALYQGVTASRRDWVDATVGHNADVAFVYSGSQPTQQPLTLWENEFFNRSIGAVYDLRQPSMGGLPETPVTLRADGVLLAGGEPLTHAYVLSEEVTPIAGTIVARDKLRGMVLRQAQRPLRLSYRLLGVFDPDAPGTSPWSGPVFAYVRYECRGGVLTVVLGSDRALFRRSQMVVANGKRAIVRPGRPTRLNVPLRSRRDGSCKANFIVTPSAIPKEVTPSSSDTRRLGVHLLALSFRSASAP